MRGARAPNRAPCNAKATAMLRLRSAFCSDGRSLQLADLRVASLEAVRWPGTLSL